MATATNCLYENRLIGVYEAKKLIETVKPSPIKSAFTCLECGEAVKPHAEGNSTAAHFEHYKRNPKCSLSHKLRANQSTQTEPIERKKWDENEIRLCVEAYLEMRQKSVNHEASNKSQTYKAIASQTNRSESSIEYRMQNISYVLALKGRTWIKGLKPAKNVGSRVASMIDGMITNIEGRTTGTDVDFEIKVRDELARKVLQEPIGRSNPEFKLAQVTQFNRDPSVKAWVLKEANGTCECCQKSAPFRTLDGTPYLEVHHLRRLADNGPDTICNSIALCPNCHRELHFGKNAVLIEDEIFSRIKRLRKAN